MLAVTVCVGVIVTVVVLLPVTVAPFTMLQKQGAWTLEGKPPGIVTVSFTAQEEVSSCETLLVGKAAVVLGS